MSPKIQYCKKDSILSFRLSKNRSVDSDIFGNAVVDYDKNGKVVNIDLMQINLENFVPIKQLRHFAVESK